MSRRRLAALAALILLAASLTLAIVVTVEEFPSGLGLVGCVIVAAAAGWYGILRRGIARAAGLGIAVVALAGGIALVVGGQPFQVAVAAVLLVLSLGAARVALALRVRHPAAPAPKHPVLIYNPKSGGGKAERFHLDRVARERGIEPVELKRGDDLEALAREAVSRGADALAMAGGDGSQAIVAAIAAELDLPYACIPAGTRNHFALDLGVDRDDVVGALEAFRDGGERLVDLAEVNGRVFVNNVSLGLYAEAVQQPGYREAKLRTLLDTVPDVLGPEAAGHELRWTGPEGDAHRAGAAILVSNNRYRLGRAVASGTRPRIDEGILGIAVVGEDGGSGHRPWHEWTAPTFEIDADGAIPAGIDGEAAVLEPPLRFGIRPGALRVRVAHAHPGASPSAGLPESALEAVLTVARVALGRREPDQLHSPTHKET